MGFVVNIWYCTSCFEFWYKEKKHDWWRSDRYTHEGTTGNSIKPARQCIVVHTKCKWSATKIWVKITSHHVS